MKHFYILLGALLTLPVWGEVRIQTDFANPQRPILQVGAKKLSSVTRGTHRHAVKGVKGNTILFAKSALATFPGSPKQVQGSLLFHGIDNFPQREGALEFYVNSYFNEPKRKVPHNYIFRFYSTEKPDRILTVFVVSHRQISVQFEFANGQSSHIHYAIKNWKPNTWQKINLIWYPGKQCLFVNDKIVVEKKIAGTLYPINALELGACYNYFPLQGMVDQFKVQDQIPRALRRQTSDPEPPQVLTKKAALLNPAAWPATSEIRSFKGKDGALHLAYAGNDYEGQIIEGPAVPVRPKTFIRGDLKFRKIKWDYSLLAPAMVTFYAKNGQMLKRYQFDQSRIANYEPFALTEFRNMCGLWETTSYFNFWAVPENAAYLRPGWFFRYNPGEVAVADLQFSQVDGRNKPWFKRPAKNADLVFPKHAMPESEVDKILARRPRTTTAIRRNQDRMELLINGKNTRPFFMHNVPYPVKEKERWTGAFGRIGFEFATLHCSLGGGIQPHMPRALMEDGSIDVTAWRKTVREHLKQNPKGYFFLALFVFPPYKWLEENDGELMKNGKGENFIYGYPYSPLGRGASKVLPKGNFSRYPSFSSKKYTSYICDKIKKALQEFEKYPESKVVAGVYLLGGDDYQFRLPSIYAWPDQGPRAQAGFREFLRNKYRTEKAMQNAWNDPHATFAKAHVPVIPEIWPPNERYHAQGGKITMLSDYKHYYTHLDRSFKSAIRQAAREAVPRYLIGGYDCAYGISGSYGHTGLYFNEALQDAANFYLFIPPYGRERDNADLPLPPFSFNGSLLLHHKLGIMELDIRNPEIGPLYWAHYRSANYVERHGADTYRISVRRNAVQAITWGCGIHYYNLQPHWCRTAKAQASLKDMHRIISEARPTPFGRDSIAVFIDEDIDLFTNTHPDWIPSFFNYKNVITDAVQNAGVKYNFFLTSDALHPDLQKEAPGVLYFAESATLTPEKIAQIRRIYGNSNRVIVWQGAPSFVVNGDYNKISQAVNFQIAPLPDYPILGNHPQVKAADKLTQPVPLVVKNSIDPIVKGIKGFVMMESEGLPRVFSPHWGVFDKSAQPLAYFYGTDVVGMAVKRHKNFTEVFIGQPGAISPELFRNFAREAGIRPSLNQNDIFCCGSGLLGVGAALGSGVRRIYFPAGYHQAEPLSGHKVIKATPDYFETYIKHRDFAVFKIK